ncbi:uncharacterized protein LOC118227553 [Anguilla anguilla]|uniref:uncharacterized protein LOC118227553 n=1 Tax=Anguilla anguilla TaxID=7936 RepID=UPI0015B353F7|nr:uncharacterized protein LOC118227553 [Anguilla anguilla]
MKLFPQNQLRKPINRPENHTSRSKQLRKPLDTERTAALRKENNRPENHTSRSKQRPKQFSRSQGTPKDGPLRSCAVSEHQGKCVHSDEERSLTGVWCSIKLAKAVEKGYQVAKIFEVWHFPQRSDSHFSGYINTHLKGKQEASGYPSWVSNDLDKDRYMQSYLEKEGIHLDPSKICVNKAKRQISKLFLNSLWGKFGQRTNQVNTALIHDPEQFLLYMFSKEYDISHFSFIT